MHLYLKENSWSNKEYHDYINIDRKYNGYEVYLNAYVEPLEKKKKIMIMLNPVIITKQFSQIITISNNVPMQSTKK